MSHFVCYLRCVSFPHEAYVSSQMCTLRPQTQTYLVSFSFQVLKLKKIELSQMVGPNVKTYEKGKSGFLWLWALCLGPLQPTKV